MKIRAIKDTTSLIGGHLYDVAAIYNVSGNGKVQLVDIGGTHFVSYFTDLNGNPLPNINAHYKDTNSYTKFEDLRVGDLVVCMSKGHKTLTYGKMYRVEELIKKRSKYTINYFEQKIKLEGVPRTYAYSSWNWRVLNKDEQRDIQLLDVLDNLTPDIVTEIITDKFAQMPNPDIELFTAICESMTDRKRHHYGLIDWYCRTVPGKRMNAKPEDFERIMNMSLRDIIKMVDEILK